MIAEKIKRIHYGLERRKKDRRASPLRQCTSCGTHFPLSLSAPICRDCGNKIAYKKTGNIIDICV